MLLGSQRDLFEIPDEVACLSCAYMPLLSRGAREVGQASVARKSQPWRVSARVFFEESETARALFGELIAAETDGVAIVLAGQFPSSGYPWRDLAERSGGEVLAVARPVSYD